MSSPHNTPYEKIDHGTAAPKVSISDVHNPNDDATRPASTADLGSLFPKITQGIKQLLPEGASGAVVPTLVPSHDPLADTEVPPTSPLAETPPWHQQGPSQTPAPQTTPTTQVFSTVEIGVNQPWKRP